MVNSTFSALLHSEWMAIGEALSIRRDLDIQKKAKEDVSWLQNQDRTIFAVAEILYRYKLVASEILRQQGAYPRTDKTFSDTFAPQMTTATLFPR